MRYLEISSDVFLWEKNNPDKNVKVVGSNSFIIGENLSITGNYVLQFFRIPKQILLEAGVQSGYNVIKKLLSDDLIFMLLSKM